MKSFFFEVHTTYFHGVFRSPKTDKKGILDKFRQHLVLQCSELFYYKASSEFLRQDSQSSYSFGKTQNVGETELSEEKKSVS